LLFSALVELLPYRDFPVFGQIMEIRPNTCCLVAMATKNIKPKPDRKVSWSVMYHLITQNVQKELK